MSPVFENVCCVASNLIWYLSDILKVWFYMIDVLKRRLLSSLRIIKY